MHPVERYIRDLRDIRATGAAQIETSGYGPLETLLSAIGKDLKPAVRCIMQLKDRGAGMPDGGLFTRDQFRKKTDAEPAQGQLPARGAIEVKPTGRDVGHVAKTDQVARYAAEYGLVLVTNYRDFLLGRPLTPDEAGHFQNAARRIAAILLLGPALDENYNAVKADAYSFPERPAEQP
jgi:hypothetical protein